jgi:hypothetical protein
MPPADLAVAAAAVAAAAGVCATCRALVISAGVIANLIFAWAVLFAQVGRGRQGWKGLEWGGQGQKGVDRVREGWKQGAVTGWGGWPGGREGVGGREGGREGDVAVLGQAGRGLH